MVGRKNDRENILSGQAQISKRKEIVTRLNILIFKWNPERIAESNYSELILNNLKAARDILNNIYIERNDSNMLGIFYATIVKNIEIIEIRQYSDKYERRSRLDSNLNIIDLVKAANDILNISQKWKECE